MARKAANKPKTDRVGNYNIMKERSNYPGLRRAVFSREGEGGKDRKESTQTKLEHYLKPKAAGPDKNGNGKGKKGRGQKRLKQTRLQDYSFQYDSSKGGQSHTSVPPKARAVDVFDWEMD